MSEIQATKEFIRLLEFKETWTLNHIDPGLMHRAEELSDLIIQDIQAAKSVPVHTWVVFLALLPYQRSLLALSDLSLVLPNLLLHIINEDYDAGSMESASRTLLVERMNILYRRKLHNDVLTKSRKQAINNVLRALDGYHE